MDDPASAGEIEEGEGPIFVPENVPMGLRESQKITDDYRHMKERKALMVNGFLRKKGACGDPLFSLFRSSKPVYRRYRLHLPMFNLDGQCTLTITTKKRV